MEAAQKAEGEGKQGSVGVTWPWLAAMPVGGCPFKNPGMGQALCIVSVLAAAFSVLLATPRKAGVWTSQQAVTPKLTRRERRKSLKVSVAALGSPDGMPSGRAWDGGIGNPHIHRLSASQRRARRTEHMVGE